VNKHKASQFARERANELRSLARLLYDHELIRDPGPLDQAAALCAASQKGEDFVWAYDFHGLSFTTITVAGNLRHSRPRSLAEVQVELHLSVSGTCFDEDEPNDPLRELVLNLEILGETKNGEVLSGAWHLDRHFLPTSDTDEDEGSNRFAHPHYHFQCGGRHVWTKSDSEFGTHLLLEPPRIAHPPLDAVLAVDFVLSNYFATGWQALREQSGAYRMLVAGAQRRLWRPYAVATAAHWNNPGSHPWNPTWIWPQLFPPGVNN
jgi:hypothetical protein